MTNYLTGDKDEKSTVKLSHIGNSGFSRFLNSCVSTANTLLEKNMMYSAHCNKLWQQKDHDRNYFRLRPDIL